MIDIINKWKDKIARYIDVRVRLFQLSVVERTSRILGYFAFTIILLLLGFAILLYLGFGLVELYSWLLNNRLFGYFLTVATYILFLVIAIVFRQPIIRRFTGIFVRALTENDDDDDEEEGGEGEKNTPGKP